MNSIAEIAAVTPNLIPSTSHSICLQCTRESYPEVFECESPLDVTTIEYFKHKLEVCCFCGWLHRSGIYIETDLPNTDIRCEGKHREVSTVGQTVATAMNNRMTIHEITFGVFVLMLVAVVAIVVLAMW